MKSFLSLLTRYALTLSAVAVSAILAFMLWKHYAQTPWTRDGRVRADVVNRAGCLRAGYQRSGQRQSVG
jgi:multidrug resistance efflux pump